MKNTANFPQIIRQCSAGILAASIFMTQAHSASLQVAPILLEFSPQEKVKELWLTNTGNADIRAQVRVNAWTQSDDQDVLIASKDLVASPMVLSIPVGQRQLVRLVRNNTVKTSEQAYRLIVDELPNQRTEGQSGLQLLLKYSIPVFFKASNDSDFSQGVTSLKGMTFKYSVQKISVTNQSSQYKRFSQLAYVDTDGNKTPIQMGLVGYVLSGQTMQWMIPQHVNITQGGKFVAVVNTDTKEQVLPLSP